MRRRRKPMRTDEMRKEHRRLAAIRERVLSKMGIENDPTPYDERAYAAEDHDYADDDFDDHDGWGPVKRRVG